MLDTNPYDEKEVVVDVDADNVSMEVDTEVEDVVEEAVKLVDVRELVEEVEEVVEVEVVVSRTLVD